MEMRMMMVVMMKYAKKAMDVFLTIEVRERSLSMMFFWKLTSSIPDCFLRKSAISGRKDGFFANISRDAGRMSDVTISKRSGLSLFSFLYISYASVFDTYLAESTFSEERSCSFSLKILFSDV